MLELIAFACPPLLAYWAMRSCLLLRGNDGRIGEVLEGDSRRFWSFFG